MKIYLAADHRGFTLKEALKPWLLASGHEVIDCGNDRLEPEDDYVDFGISIARHLAEDLHHGADPEKTFAIGICGSGVGIAIAANRIRGIRAAQSITAPHIKHARENDHVNTLSLASEFTSEEDAKEIITTFLTTKPIRIEKYVRRARKLDEIV